MNAPAPVPPAVLAALKRHYDTRFDVLKKDLEDHHAQISEVQEEYIGTLSAQVFAQQKQIRFQCDQLESQEAHTRELQEQIAELKGRLERVAESVTGIVSKASERKSEYGSHGRDSRGGMAMERIEEQTVSSKVMSDLSFRQDKELPPRPESAVSSLINDIEDMIGEIESAPDRNTSVVPSYAADVRSSSSQAVVVVRPAVVQQPLYPSFHHIPPPTHALGPDPRAATASPRLRPIDEDVNDSPTANPHTLHHNEYQPITARQPRTSSSAPPQPQRTSLPPTHPFSPRPHTEIHPLLRELLPPRPRSSSSEYSRPPSPPMAPLERKETFIEMLKHRQPSFGLPKPSKKGKSVDVPEESDSVIRFKIRSEAERRRAASFTPEDRVERSGVVHSMILSPTLLTLQTPEVAMGGDGGEAGSKAEQVFGRPQLDAMKRVRSDGSQGTEKARGMMMNVLRRFRSDVWKKGTGRIESTMNGPRIE